MTEFTVSETSKRATDRSYGATEAMNVVQADSLRACNARTLEKLNDLHANTMQLVEIIAQLGGHDGSTDGPGNALKEPSEPSAPIFQARRIEQRLEQQIEMQRTLINKLRSLIG